MPELVVPVRGGSSTTDFANPPTAALTDIVPTQHADARALRAAARLCGRREDEVAKKIGTVCRKTDFRGKRVVRASRRRDNAEIAR